MFFYNISTFPFINEKYAVYPFWNQFGNFELWCWRKLLSPLDCKEIKPVNTKGNQSWIFTGRIDAETETPILWPPDAKNWLLGKRPWCWERLKAGGEGDDRGWDGWMASPTWWTRVWASSRSWWWTGKPGVLRSMRSQRVGHNWGTELMLFTQLFYLGK